MIPWLILAVVAVPLVVVGFASTRRRATAPATDEAKLESEVAAAEAYEAEWHRKDVERFSDERLP